MRFASLKSVPYSQPNLQDPGKAENIADSKEYAENDRHCKHKRVNQHEAHGILPSCSDHQHLMRAIVPIQCTLQARKKTIHGQQQHIT